MPKSPSFRIRKLHGDDRVELVVTHTVAVQARHDLVESQLEEPLVGLAHFLVDSRFGGKLRVALELYAAHFNERQVRVRFILLVIAMEALAEARMKDQAALDHGARIWTRRKPNTTRPPKPVAASPRLVLRSAISSLTFSISAKTSVPI